ncbi:MAG TPA: VOC family protein [Candidatus Binatia bacterium]|jgi:catechol 2,3-dioxygenase-like lactoylglutathione lyase family enzyme|nr:VOC family protein [Candidatus Binatia bacterium]
MAPIKIIELDHIVLNVNDIERSLLFYTQILGLKGERIDEFKSGKVGFPSVRINEGTIIDLFPAKQPRVSAGNEKNNGNLNHFCMVVGAEDFAGIIGYLAAHKITIREGPVSRWGARGRATSVYFLDPDGNEVEIRCY